MIANEPPKQHALDFSSISREQIYLLVLNIIFDLSSDQTWALVEGVAALNADTSILRICWRCPSIWIDASDGLHKQPRVS